MTKQMTRRSNIHDIAKNQSVTIIAQQGIIAALLQITLDISKRYNKVCRQNKLLAKSLHKEIDYSDKLESKVKNLNKRKKKNGR